MIVSELTNYDVQHKYFVCIIQSYFNRMINLEYTIDLVMVIDILLIKMYVTLISFETTNLVEVIVM